MPLWFLTVSLLQYAVQLPFNVFYTTSAVYMQCCTYYALTVTLCAYIRTYVLVMCTFGSCVGPGSSSRLSQAHGGIERGSRESESFVFSCVRTYVRYVSRCGTIVI